MKRLWEEDEENSTASLSKKGGGIIKVNLRVSDHHTETIGSRSLSCAVGQSLSG